MSNAPQHTDFYRGKCCNFMPTGYDNIISLEDIERFILSGWTPKEPFIKKTDNIIAFGSCFADQIQNFLRDNNYSIPPIEKCNITKYGAGMANTYTLVQQLRWAYNENNNENNNDIWYFDPAFPPIYRLNEDRQVTKELFDETKVFIITLGLSEIWYEKESGYVFWKAVPGKIFDENKHGFRVTTVNENKSNIQEVISIIRHHNPSATIIFTLSPVSLLATFRPVSCITANSVSKAILRVTIDEIMRENTDTNIFYWPSYEIVTAASMYGFEQDHRHPKKELVDKIMALFGKYFLV